MNQKQLSLRIQRLECDLAAATLEIRRMRQARHHGAAFAAVALALIIGASSALNAQTPTRIIRTPEEQVVELFRRVTALEKQSTSRVRAPFEVVDSAGKIVFRVKAGAPGNSFSLYNGSGVASLFGSAFAGLFVTPGGKSQVFLGTSPDGKPTLQLINSAGAVATSLQVGARGGGLLQISNAQGHAQVEAGVLDSGAGLVRTFPNGNPGAGLVGMPGTFIMGRGGE